MKQALFILLALIFLSFIGRNRVKHSFESQNIVCHYETNEGRIDGNYSSYYKNGKKKAEGRFENNYRVGKWTVWDSAGRMRMQRDYSDPFTFKRLFPEVPKDKVIDLLNVSPYAMEYNKDGFIESFYLEPRAIIWAKRIWRYVKPNENNILFENDKLFSILNKNIYNGNITPYQATDDEFLKELHITDLDTSAIELIGYKIKEDCIFDIERLVTESRILGICPVVVNKVKQDTLDLYWIYFPQARKYLAQEKILHTKLPSHIRTLDDVFFYRYFYGQIYKEATVHDRPISAYKSGLEIEKEAERIEISLIESEHDIWITLTE
jgi:hypothetical protein